MLSVQEVKQLKQEIQSSQHEVFIISLEEMDSITNPSATAKIPYKAIASVIASARAIATDTAKSSLNSFLSTKSRLL